MPKRSHNQIRIWIKNLYIEWFGSVQQKERLHLEREASDLLKMRSHQLFVQMLNNGYVMTKEQEQHVNELIKESLDNSSQKAKLIDDMVGWGYQLNSQNLIDIFFDYKMTRDWIERGKQKSILEKIKDIPLGILFEKIDSSVTFNKIRKTLALSSQIEDKNIKPHIFSLLQKKENQLITFNHWYNLFLTSPTDYGNNKALERTYSLMKQFWVPLLDNKTLKILLSHQNKENENLAKEIENDFNELNRHEKENLILRTKNLYMEEHVKEIVENIQKNKVKNISLNVLPDNSYQTIQQIENYYLKLKDIHLNTQTKLEIDNIIQKRIPQAIEKYLSIDDEYRISLVNHQGKNAQDLLYDSLINYLDCIKQHWEVLNTQKLNDLNIQEKYSSSLLKSKLM